MAFPDAPRVIYENNPLDEVICQLRFPPILRIDAEPPAGFQEQIRDEYPFYETKEALKLPAGLPQGLAQSLIADLPFAGRKSHTFGSRDQVWSLSLNREFLALTCQAYTRWEDFEARGAFRGASTALQAVLLHSHRPALQGRYPSLAARASGRSLGRIAATLDQWRTRPGWG